MKTVYAHLKGCLLCVLSLGIIAHSSLVLGAKIQVHRDTSTIKAVNNLKKSEIISALVNSRLPFILNEGQIEEKIKFYARTFGGTVFVTKDAEIIYSLRKSERDETAKGLAIKEELVGGNIDEVRGGKRAITRVSYFKGKDRSRWRSNIPTYDLVEFLGVYDGIDLKLSARGNNVEKLFFLRPGAKPETIKLELSGAEGLKTNEYGELEVDTELGVVKFTTPVAYQEVNGKRKYVEVAYLIHGNVYGFDLGDYDRSKELIIDPMLASTLIGGGDADLIDSISIDRSGNVYVSGETRSSDFPTTTGAYDTEHNSYADGFVSKFDADLQNLLASTFIGGAHGDNVNSMYLDGSGNVFVAGRTWSSDFPTTTGAYDTTHNGYSDVFVSKFDSSLQNLLASTLLGGGNEEEAYSVGLNSTGNVYVAGQTKSSDLPTTPGAYDRIYNGGSGGYPYGDPFVAKLDGNLQNLLASTYFGGTANDWLHSMSMDSGGNIYIAGMTESSGDFPTTPGAYDTTYSVNGNTSWYISKLDGDLQNLLASTFFKGWGNSILMDDHGYVYVAGTANRSDFPTTPGAYDRTFNNGDAFISRLDSNLQSLLASTLLGGNDWDKISSMSLDNAGNVYVTGITESRNFPTTPGAYDTTYNGDTDAFASKLDSNLQSLLASTLLGGSDWDEISSMSLDNAGNVYVAGLTGSRNFPTTINAYDSTHHGAIDGFVLRLDKEFVADATSSVSPSRHYYGRVGLGRVSVETFTISNAGGVDLIIGTLDITGVDASEFFIASDFCSGQTLSPSPADTCAVQVSFAPTSEGAKRAFLTIPSNNPVTPTLDVRLTGWGGTEPVEGKINLPQTGQETCYAAWDDGALQKGVLWPTPRFEDNGDGTIKDNLTGLMWLKSGNCFGPTSWNDAIAKIADLNASPGNYDCSGYSGSYSDWRFSNLNELESLLNLEAGNISEWLKRQGFSSVQADDYWSSSSNGEYHAWHIDMENGGLGSNSHKGNTKYVWPVRSKTTGPARVWRTGQEITYTTGDDGDLRMGVSWPRPRFTDYGDGTITDNLTGLMWLKDAGCIVNHLWQEGIDAIVDFNQDPGEYNCQEYTASYSDWYLPNTKELRSLVNYGPSAFGSLAYDGFENVGLGYWSSTTSAESTDNSWGVWFNTGGVGTHNKTSYGRNVWPVRHDKISPYLDLPNVFGIKVGSVRTYRGTSYTLNEEVVSLNTGRFPADTYVVERREGGSLVGEEWYERTPQMLKIWRLTGTVVGSYGTYEFSDGLVVAWYPMEIGDREESFATTEGAYNVSLTVDVLNEEPVALRFDTLDAYKLRYRLRVWSPVWDPDFDVTDTFYKWIVPYLGTVKNRDAEGHLERLTSFSMGCGTITQLTDYDNDALNDYEELIIYSTNWQDADTDRDGMPDGWEAVHGLDPLADDADGDLDQDGFTNLEEYQEGTNPDDPHSHPVTAMPWIPLLLLGD